MSKQVDVTSEVTKEKSRTFTVEVTDAPDAGPAPEPTQKTLEEQAAGKAALKSYQTGGDKDDKKKE